jgi:light-regulated signal transduction histidine kinase (bacteriophytochrome)
MTTPDDDPDDAGHLPESERVSALLAELALRDRELADLCYGVAHDLRAPLRAITAFSEALSEDYGDRLDDEGRDYVARVRGAAARMDSLIASLTELANVGRQPLHREPVDLSALAESIALGLKSSDPARSVAFTIEPHLAVQGDGELLRRALEHLFANAWKFTRRHDSANVAFGRTELNGRFAIYVRDDGAGFDPAFMHKLFVPFQRLHSASEFEGNGIGLAVVRRIAHLHGGTVSASGGVEQGATILVQIP